LNLLNQFKMENENKTLEIIALIKRLDNDLENAIQQNKDKTFGVPIPFYIIRGLSFIFLKSGDLIDKDVTAIFRENSINTNDLNYAYLEVRMDYAGYIKEKYFDHSDTFSSKRFYADFLISYNNPELKQKLFWDLRQLLIRLRDKNYSQTMDLDILSRDGQGRLVQNLVPFSFNNDGILHFILLNLFKIPEAKISLNEFSLAYNLESDLQYISMKEAMQKFNKKKWYDVF